MTDATVSLSTSRLKARREDRLMFKVLFALAFPVFLIATLSMRAVGAGGGAAAAGDPVSVFGQAKVAASAAIAFAFMG